MSTANGASFIAIAKSRMEERYRYVRYQFNSRNETYDLAVLWHEKLIFPGIKSTTIKRSVGA